jgi:hypothetical protein
VTRKLGGQRDGECRERLRETVGQLILCAPAVPEALAALGVPLITTNYDGLLEQVTWRGGTVSTGLRISSVLAGVATIV